MKSSNPPVPSVKFPLIKVSLAIALAVISWSSALVFIRIGLKGYHPGSLALLRFIVASVCLFFVFLPSSKHFKASKDAILLACITGIVGIGLYNIALNYGELTVNSGIAGFLISQIPVVAIFLSIMFLKEQVTSKVWMGMGISVIGVSLIALAHRQGATWDIGILYVLIATLCGGAYSVLSKSLVLKIHPLALATYVIWSGTLFLMIFIKPLLQEITVAPAAATWAAVYLGVVPGCLGYVAWTYALGYLPASKASTFLYMMPIIATALGWFMLDEIPNALSFVGGLTALCGAVVINQRNQRKKEDREEKKQFASDVN